MCNVARTKKSFKIFVLVLLNFDLSEKYTHFLKELDSYACTCTCGSCFFKNWLPNFYYFCNTKVI